MDIALQEKLPKKNKVCVYIDDNRTPTEIPMGYDPWIIIRSYDELVEFIPTFYREHKGEDKKIPDLFSFDHDLTEEYIDWYFMHPGEKIIDYGEFKTKGGFHCAKWLIEACEKNGVSLEDTLFAIHSNNELGGQNIQGYINKYKGEKWGLGKANCFLNKWSFEYDQKQFQKQQKEHQDGDKKIS